MSAQTRIRKTQIQTNETYSTIHTKHNKNKSKTKNQTKIKNTALQDIPTMMLFPIFPVAFSILLFVGWGLLTLCIFSNGETKEIDNHHTPTNFNGISDGIYQINQWPQKITRIDYQQTVENYSFLLHLFFLLWAFQIVIYATYTIIAGTIADWFILRLSFTFQLS